MKVIKCLSEKIAEEIEDADSYIELAIQWKDEEPETAELFYQLSIEEMGHMDRLHSQVTDLISAYREENGDPPAGMLALYEYMHKKHMENAMRVKVRQQMYKG